MRYASKKLILGVVLFAALTGFGVFYFAAFHRGEAVIWNVPYEGIYTVGADIHGPGAAVFSVLKYWRQFDASLPDPTPASLFKAFSVEKRDVAEYFQGLGYRVDVIRTRNPGTLLRYIEEEKSPLIFMSSPLADPEVNIGLAPRVLIGVSLKKKTLTVHDMYFGPAYELGVRDWRRSHPSALAENFKFVFIAARPPNYKDLLARASLSQTSYPDRGEYDRYREIVALFARSTLQESWSDLNRITLIEAIVDHPQFPEMPRFFRVTVYNRLALSLNATGQYAKGRQYAEDAVADNVDLDEPAGVWRYGLFARSPQPWKLLGDAYLGLGERGKAREAYRKAIEAYAAFPPEWHDEVSPRYDAAEKALADLGGQ